MTPKRSQLGRCLRFLSLCGIQAPHFTLVFYRGYQFTLRAHLLHVLARPYEYPSNHAAELPARQIVPVKFAYQEIEMKDDFNQFPFQWKRKDLRREKKGAVSNSKTQISPPFQKKRSMENQKALCNFAN